MPRASLPRRSGSTPTDENCRSGGDFVTGGGPDDRLNPAAGYSFHETEYAW